MTPRINLPKPPTRAAAFTLVELLVVIGIIGLLISIALPAFSRVRKSAKETATHATIRALEVGITSYRADTQIGGNYPPSSHLANVADPHDQGQTIDFVNGAELLVWALAGADQLGSPGFKNINGTTNPKFNDDAIGGWTDDTGKDNPSSLPARPMLYSLDANGQPVYSRKQFVELKSMKFPVPVKNSATETVFEYRDLPKVNGAYVSRPTLTFLDTFGQPILYYRANRTATQMVGYGIDSKNDPELATPPQGVYQLADNREFTGVNDAQSGTAIDGMDLGAGVEHPLRMLPDPTNTTNYPTDPAQAIKPQGSFPQVLQNMKITAKRQPVNDDSFILLSAGADGRYGTGDDIANFDINQ